MSRYDYPDPGLDAKYCDGLSGFSADEQDEQTRQRFLDACTHAVYTALNDFRDAQKACRTAEDARELHGRLHDLEKLLAGAVDDAADLMEQLS